MRDQDVRNGLRYLTYLLARKDIAMPEDLEEDEITELVGHLADDELNVLLDNCRHQYGHSDTAWGRSVCMLQIEAVQFHIGERGFREQFQHGGDSKLTKEQRVVRDRRIRKLFETTDVRRTELANNNNLSTRQIDRILKK